MTPLLPWPRRAGVLTSPPTALYLLLGSLLATLLVLVLRSAAGEQQLQRRRRRRLTRDRGGTHAPQVYMAARLQLWAGGLTLLGQLLAMGSKSELLVSCCTSTAGFVPLKPPRAPGCACTVLDGGG